MIHFMKSIQNKNCGCDFHNKKESDRLSSLGEWLNVTHRLVSSLIFQDQAGTGSGGTVTRSSCGAKNDTTSTFAASASHCWASAR